MPGMPIKAIAVTQASEATVRGTGSDHRKS